MNDLRPLRVFLEVAERSSFAAAARALGMTPATVTRIVARLETELGQQLLLRTTRQVSLTSAGAVVAARVRPLLAEVDQVARDLSQNSPANRGHLRLNVPLSLGQRVLPPIIADFRQSFPEITLNVTLTDALVDIIAETCDLAIRISGPPQDKSTIWRKICAVPRRVVVAPSLLAQMPAPTTPDALPRDLCLSYGTGPETWAFRNGPQTCSIRAGEAVISNNGDFLYGLVTAGQGIAVLPDFIVDPGIARGEVVPILDQWQVPSLWLTLFYPPYEQLPPLVATVSDFVEAWLQGPDGLVRAQSGVIPQPS